MSSITLTVQPVTDCARVLDEKASERLPRWSPVAVIIIQQIVLSIAVALCAITVGKMIWSALELLWGG
jgi:hypothetical protein